MSDNSETAGLMLNPLPPERLDRKRRELDDSRRGVERWMDKAENGDYAFKHMLIGQQRLYITALEQYIQFLEASIFAEGNRMRFTDENAPTNG